MGFKGNMENIKFNNLINMANVKLLIWQMLLFLMIFIPRKGQQIKLVFLLLLLFFSVIGILKKGSIRLSREIVIFYLFHLSYVIFSGFKGLLKGNPGAIDFLRVNFIYYIIFLIILFDFRKVEILNRTIKTIVISANCISIYTIMLLLVKLGIWPERFFIYFDVTSNVGIHKGYTHLVNTNLSMMIFILPFFLTLYLNKVILDDIKKFTLLLAIILGMTATLLSGRRILWLSFVIPILFYYLKPQRWNVKERIKMNTILIITISLIILFISKNSYFSLEGIIDRLFSAFNRNIEDIRFLQMEALWNGFLENPISGSGAGQGVKAVVRSVSSPWIYEMTYNLILYNSGIIGSFVFCSGHIYMIYALFKKRGIKPLIGEGLLVGYIVMLFASGTNPYFTSSFDFLWFIIFPLLFLNIIGNEYKKEVF